MKDKFPNEKGDVSIGNGKRVHPQLAPDRHDPLNWSWLHKHTILGIVMLKYVCLLPARKHVRLPIVLELKVLSLHIHHHNDSPVASRDSISVRHQLCPGQLDRGHSRPRSIGRTTHLVFSVRDIWSSDCVYCRRDNCSCFDYRGSHGRSVWGLYGCEVLSRVWC